MRSPFHDEAVKSFGVFHRSSKSGPTSNSSTDSARLARIIIYAPSDQRCTPDVDGDGQFSATTDGLIVLRVMFGMNVSAAINAAGSRNSNVLLRDYLLTHCGINPVL